MMMFLCILTLMKDNDTEHKEFNMDHFILHVTTDGK